MKRQDLIIVFAACFFVSAGQLQAQYIGRVGIDADVCSKAGRELRPSAGESPVEYTLRNDSAVGCNTAREIPNGPTIDRLLDAIKQVESGGNNKAVGDGGKARGGYQLWYSFYTDGKPGVVREYGECPSYEVTAASDVWARRVIISWWRRYASEALARGDFETLARRFNGGPRGERVAATEKYWVKVKKEMERAK